MPRTKGATAERVAAEWAVKVNTLVTLLERLELLSSLRDPHTGVYVHHGMSSSIGSQTHDVLFCSHKELFAEWQAMDLRQQMRDLRRFIALKSAPLEGSSQKTNADTRTRKVLETWTELEPYRSFVPLSVSKLERELFLLNLTSLIAILKAQLAERTEGNREE